MINEIKDWLKKKTHTHKWVTTSKTWEGFAIKKECGCGLLKEFSQKRIGMTSEYELIWTYSDGTESEFHWEK